MKKPSTALLSELTIALQEADHPTEAQDFMLRLLQALYSEWFEVRLLKHSSSSKTESAEVETRAV